LENVDATRGHVDVLWQSAAGYDACGRCAASHASRSSTDLRSRVQMRLKSADAKEGVGLIVCSSSLNRAGARGAFRRASILSQPPVPMGAYRRWLRAYRLCCGESHAVERESL